MKSNADKSLSFPRRSWLTSAIAALLTTSALSFAPHAQAAVRVGLSINIAPPALPVYEQPPIPAPGYLWTPGYWAYGEDGYYWVPGTWVQPPYVGALWTPGYWGYNNNVYVFNAGYWGRHVGYYGGINYGFGYVGVGYVGGYWGHGHFWYNSAVNRFGGVRVTNVYNHTVVNVTDNHFSFNGPGGVEHRPTRQEVAFSHERHMAPIRQQVQQRELASHNESLRASENHGTPSIMATRRPGDFAHANAQVTANRNEQRHGDESGSEVKTAAGERTAAEQRQASVRAHENARSEERTRTHAGTLAPTERAEAARNQASERTAERTEALRNQATERTQQAQRIADERVRSASEETARATQHREAAQRQASARAQLQKENGDARERASAERTDRVNERAEQRQMSERTQERDNARATANVDNRNAEREQADRRQESTRAALANRTNVEHRNQAQPRQNRPARQEARRQPAAPRNHERQAEHKPRQNGD